MLLCKHRLTTLALHVHVKWLRHHFDARAGRQPAGLETSMESVAAISPDDGEANGCLNVSREHKWGVDEHSFHIRVSAKDGWNDEP